MLIVATVGITIDVSRGCVSGNTTRHYKSCQQWDKFVMAATAYKWWQRWDFI
jgi:hypothetical protein